MPFENDKSDLELALASLDEMDGIACALVNAVCGANHTLVVDREIVHTVDAVCAQIKSAIATVHTKIRACDVRKQRALRLYYADEFRPTLREVAAYDDNGRFIARGTPWEALAGLTTGFLAGCTFVLDANPFSDGSDRRRLDFDRPNATHMTADEFRSWLDYAQS